MTDAIIPLGDATHIIIRPLSADETVEFAFRDINKPMGVATYKTSSELPREYQGILPEPEELRKLM